MTFTRQAMGFWHELAAEMNREWFLQNKQRYQQEWVEPTEAILAKAREKLAPVYKPLALGAPKVMRIHRDVRFSKDKSPYKTHIGAVLRLEHGDPAAFYLHIGLEEPFLGVGTYFFERDALDRWRKAVVGKPGAELAKLVGKLRAAKYEVGGHDDYKKVPRGFDEAHPRADLLKMKGLTGGLSIPHARLWRSDLADWLVGHARALAPIVKWLHAHV